MVEQTRVSSYGQGCAGDPLYSGELFIVWTSFQYGQFGQRQGSLSPKRIEQLDILKLNEKVVRVYEEHHGIPEKKPSPASDDFEIKEDFLHMNLGPVEDEFDLEYEEFSEEEEDLPDIELD